MPTEALAPDVLLVQTNLLGVVGDIDEDPETSPEGNWLEADNNRIDTICRVSFPTPAGLITQGVDQEFKVRCRKTIGGGSPNPDITIEVYLGGSFEIATSVTGFEVVSLSFGEIVSATWDADAFSQAELIGDTVECHIIGDHSSGPPSGRRTVEIGAVEWNAIIDGVRTRHFGVVG